MPTPRPRNLGIRHIALFVRDMEKSRRFYCDLLGMTVEWQPDPDNLYLTSGRDNLALHRAEVKVAREWAAQRLDHFGFALATPEDVDRWADYLRENGITLHKDPKTHRDGSRSFYVADPDGNVIQFIHYERMG